ncbi:hypothetical protein [Streptomyces paromomycinus]|uniref:Uncharacterized protein n=1 Tax=Streptomyces paromomycinus TaxID=92743 RepID=A0A401W471_STREY|nr:hypothetical protein [Streptomyces paromomycinus]GCD44127.1 hypothetical protein GKJPGBOP_03818 [Streptomyces paromomycinus]
MSERLDVRRMLLARGWTEKRSGLLMKGGACWAVTNDCGDSSLSGPRRGRCDGQFTFDFPGDVPARVIVSAAEAAAEVRAE